jgi:Ca-activated chloride channel family protein
MKFENPLAFIYIFWAVPLLCIFWFVVWRMRKKVVNRFVEKRLLTSITATLHTRSQYMRYALLSAAILFALFSLSRPQFGFRWQEITQEGMDIIFAVDTSKSMLTQDLKPDRLKRAKLAIKSLVPSLRGDRIGLVAFAGSAFLQCPLTLDYDGFLLSVEDLDVDSIPRGGTSLESAIDEATRAYVQKYVKNRVLIIVSDGEQHEGDAVKAAEQAKKDGIRIYCIGVGSARGKYVPSSDISSGKRFMTDAMGNRVVSKLDEKLLKEIAFITNGAYIRSTSTNFGLEALYKEKISKLEKRQIKGRKRRQYHERFQIPLFLSILLLCAEFMIKDRKD